MESILIGKISSIHGIKGEVRIYPYTDDMDKFCERKKVYLDNKLETKLKITRCRIQKNMLIAKFEGINSVEEAEKLKDQDIFVDKETFEDLEDDIYYVDDLIGIEVLDAKNNDEFLGSLIYVFNTGANDVYEIELTNGKKIYLPAIKDVIKKVDIKNKKMFVEIMEGLI